MSDGPPEPASPSSSSRLISASAVMAAGTLTSRVLGFGRLMLLVLLLVLFVLACGGGSSANATAAWLAAIAITWQRCRLLKERVFKRLFEFNSAHWIVVEHLKN